MDEREPSIIRAYSKLNPSRSGKLKLGDIKQSLRRMGLQAVRAATRIAGATSTAAEPDGTGATAGGFGIPSPASPTHFHPV